MNDQLLVRLIEANQKAGRQVSIVDNTANPNLYGPIEGGVMLESDALLYKMAIGKQRYYVSDITKFIQRGTLSVKVTK